MTAEANQPDEATTESRVRHRTRAAVVEAALELWATDFTASLTDIADSASVSRSTLHRYFPDRQSLVDATLQQAMTKLEDAYSQAALGCVSAREELEVLQRATVDVADAVMFLYSDPHRFAGNENWPREEGDHGDLIAVIERAQADGDIATDVNPRWVVSIFYSLVYVAAEGVSTGYISRHRAGDLSVRAFFGAVAPPRPAQSTSPP